MHSTFSACAYMYVLVTSSQVALSFVGYIRVHVHLYIMYGDIYTFVVRHQCYTVHVFVCKHACT